MLGNIVSSLLFVVDFFLIVQFMVIGKLSNVVISLVVLVSFDLVFYNGINFYINLIFSDYQFFYDGVNFMLKCLLDNIVWFGVLIGVINIVLVIDL